MLKVVVDTATHLSFVSFLRPRYRRELKAEDRSYQSGRISVLFKERLSRYSIAVVSGLVKRIPTAFTPLLGPVSPQVTP